MRTFEVLFILSPQVTEEEATNLIGELKNVATSTGATLASEEPWGRRRLAYPIHKFNEGIYHLFIFESENSLAELDRRMKNMDKIIRHLIVRTDLETRRAVKLAKKNPKKERVRPMPAGSVAVAAPAAAPEVVAPAPAPEVAPEAPAATEAPAAE